MTKKNRTKTHIAVGDGDNSIDAKSASAELEMELAAEFSKTRKHRPTVLYTFDTWFAISKKKSHWKEPMRRFAQIQQATLLSCEDWNKLFSHY